MTTQSRIPDPETRKKSAEKLRQVCQMYDQLNLLLDQAIAQAEVDIRNSPLEKAKQLIKEKDAKDNDCKAL